MAAVNMYSGRNSPELHTCTVEHMVCYVDLLVNIQRCSSDHGTYTLPNYMDCETSGLLAAHLLKQDYKPAVLRCILT